MIKHFAIPSEPGLEVSVQRTEEGLRAGEREQRDLVEQLKAERSRLVCAQRVAKIGSWETCLKTKAVAWSDETHRIFETDPAVFRPTHAGFLALVHPEDRAGVDEAFARSLNQTEACGIEHRVLLPDGRIKFVEERWQVFFGAEGKPVEAIGTCQDVTERKRTETALRESAAEFRTLAEAMPQIVWITRADGWNVYFNQQWMDYTGLALEQSLGHGWNQPFHEDDQRRAWDAWQRATATAGVYSLECRLRRADGVYRWWLIRGVPLQDGAGTILKWFGTCTDIHDLKEAELEISRMNRELREIEENFRQLADNVTDVFWITSPDWRTVHYVSRAYERVWGRPVEGLYADPRQWFEAILPEERERVFTAFAGLGPNQSTVSVEYPIACPDGTVHWISSRGSAVRDGEGKLIRVTGIASDITERKRSEQAVERALQRLNQAQHIGRIGDWEYDIAANSFTWSPQVFEIAGRDPLLGPPGGLEENAALYEPASRELLLEKIGRAIESGMSQECELQLRRPEGGHVPVHAMAVPKKDETGRVVGLYGTIQDISARKRDERAIRDRARQQELIATLGCTALAGTDLNRVFEEAAWAIAKGLNVGYSKVMQLAGDGAFVLEAGVGWEPGWVGRRVPREQVDTRLAGVLASGNPVIIDDFGEPRVSASELLRAHGIASGVDLAIVCGEGPCGVLGGFSREVRKFSPENLAFLQSIANILGTVIDRKRREAQLEHLAQYDPLTDLPNRLLLNDRLAVALAQARRSGERLAVLYLDLDHFKDVNDSFGHGLGDRLLQEVARRLTATMRASDTVSRQGGDEFLVLLPQAGCEKEAAQAAGRLLQALAQPVNLGNVDLLVSGSVGIACFPENGADAETLLRNADAALYAAKELGRNCYQFYSDEMNTRARGRLMLEADLSRAIERNELFLQFQPQVALRSQAVTGVEALVRWRHPALGVVPPGEFIPVAEESGLIVAIGNWVLDAACRQQAQWVRDGLISGAMAVNVSAPQFSQAAFAGIVLQTLERTGLEPRYLELELTESVVMHRVDMVREKLIGLNKLGVKLAIDDFGTGQSSLSYLQRFPIHRLKIDRSFVSGLGEGKESRAIVQAVIGLGHSLGLNVVAEGIETQAQAEYLESMGCDDAQGFLYCRPLGAADCTAFLRNAKARLSLAGAASAAGANPGACRAVR